MSPRPFRLESGTVRELRHACAHSLGHEGLRGFRAAVRARVVAMLNSDASPYEPALEVLGLASGGMPVDDGDEACNSLALIWGEPTDWFELRPAETDQAKAHMITAAREWLAVEGGREAEALYFDRWLHDILGFERRSAPPQV